MVTSQLAKSGMKGRKRDTRLLRAVITLSFLFITVATILISSVQATENARRYSLYGEWQLCYFGADGARRDALGAHEAVEQSAASLIVGETEKCGLVGTADESLFSMANLTLLEGRMPETENEIVVESAQLGAMGNDIGLGSTFTLTFEQKLFDLTVRERRLKVSNAISDIIKKHGLEALSETLSFEFWNYYVEDYTFWAEYRGDAVPVFEELTPEEHLDIFEKWFYYYGVPTYAITSNDTRGTGDMLVRLSSDLEYYGDPIEYKDRYQDFQKDAYTKGMPMSQSVTIMRDYTVVGILETYTDRWDSGGQPLPNAFVTPASGESVLNACEVFEDTLEFAPELEHNYNLFLMGDDPVSLRAELDPLYQDFIKADSDRLSYELLPEDGLLVIRKNGEEYSFTCYVNEEDPAKSEVIADEMLGTFYYLDTFFDEANIEQLTVEEQIALSRLYRGEADAIARMYETNPPLRLNSYAYPPEQGNTQRTLMITVVGVIFITSLCAVFQIFLTQMKRRTRRIALMKAIGATNAQVGVMLLWECAYLVLFGLPLGAALGAGLSYGAVAAVNLSRGGAPLLFTVNAPSLLLGLLCGVAAALLGVIVPLLIAIKTPLTGSIQVVARKKRASGQRRRVRGPATATFAAVSWRHIRANSGRTWVEFALCAFIISILLVSVMLAFLGFGDYKVQVLLANKPDFELEASFAMPLRQLEEKLGDLNGFEHIEVIEAYEKGERAYLTTEAITKGEARLPAAFRQMLHESVRSEYFGQPAFSSAALPDVMPETLFTPDGESGLSSLPESYVTDLYCVDAESEFFQKILAAIPDHAVDPEAFAAGEQVILIVPLHQKGLEEPDGVARLMEADLENLPFPSRISRALRQARVYASSLSRFDAAYYDADDSVRTGDAVVLSAASTTVKESGYSTKYIARGATVAGVLHYFPGEGLWPFTNDVMSHSVVCSINLLNKLYPKSGTRLDPVDIRRINIMSAIFYPADYGRTVFNLYCDEEVTRENTDLPLLRYASQNLYTLRNHRETKAALYDAAVSNALITGLLGAAAGIIALVILYNTIVSTHEQERRRFGVLQAMGVSKGRFYALELITGFSLGLLAVLLANALVFGVLLVSSLSANAGLGLSLSDLLKETLTARLWLYPFGIHAALCGGFLVLTTLMQALPLKAVLRHSPIENIRG